MTNCLRTQLFCRPGLTVFIKKSVYKIILAPSAQPHVSEIWQTSSSLLVSLIRYLLAVRIHAIDVKMMSRRLAPSSPGTINKKPSDPFTDSCTWVNCKQSEPIGFKFTMSIPSTTIQSSRTCPEVSGRGCSRRPRQAGHQIWRANPGLGALLPIGAWSISHWHSTFRFKINKKVN